MLDIVVFLTHILVPYLSLACGSTANLNLLTTGAWLIRSNEVAMLMVVNVLVDIIFMSTAHFISVAS